MTATAPFKVGERIHLPFHSTDGQPNTGTVIAAEPHRFRVTWDNPCRTPRQPRVRTWHAASEAFRFRRGNYGELA